MMQHHPLTEKVIGCAMKVHTKLGPGFLESVYQNALRYELTKTNLSVAVQRPIPVLYDGIAVGDFVADMVVNEILIIEIKAAAALAPAHEVQLVNYLSATNIEIGLLLNFGAASLQFKRKHRTYIPAGSSQRPVLNPVNPVNPV
jgi:GxxExxY protein